MNRYKPVGLVGKGSFGSAVLVKSIEGGETFVAKTIELNKLKSDRDRRNAQNEAAVLATLNHPNIVRYRESFQEGDVLFIIQEFADGGDLLKYVNSKLEKNQKIDEVKALHVVFQLSLALQYLHSKKILHRDIKTENIFLSNTGGTVKLGDFGLSRVLQHTESLAQTQCGTPNYFAPELCAGLAYDSKADIWALGCVMYEMLNMERLFDGSDMKKILRKVQHWTGPAKVRRPYSFHLRQLVRNCLERDPHQRPSMETILQLELFRTHRRYYGYTDSDTTPTDSQPVAPMTPVTQPPALSPGPLSPNQGGSQTPPPPPPEDNPVAVPAPVPVPRRTEPDQGVLVLRIEAQDRKPVPNFDQQPHPGPAAPTGVVYGRRPSEGNRWSPGSAPADPTPSEPYRARRSSPSERSTPPRHRQPPPPVGGAFGGAIAGRQASRSPHRAPPPQYRAAVQGRRASPVTQRSAEPRSPGVAGYSNRSPVGSPYSSPYRGYQAAAAPPTDVNHPGGCHHQPKGPFEAAGLRSDPTDLVRQGYHQRQDGHYYRVVGRSNSPPASQRPSSAYGAPHRSSPRKDRQAATPDRERKEVGGPSPPHGGATPPRPPQEARGEVDTPWSPGQQVANVARQLREGGKGSGGGDFINGFLMDAVGGGLVPGGVPVSGLPPVGDVDFRVVNRQEMPLPAWALTDDIPPPPLHFPRPERDLVRQQLRDFDPDLTYSIENGTLHRSFQC